MATTWYIVGFDWAWRPLGYLVPRFHAVVLCCVVPVRSRDVRSRIPSWPLPGTLMSTLDGRSSCRVSRRFGRLTSVSFGSRLGKYTFPSVTGSSGKVLSERFFRRSAVGEVLLERFFDEGFQVLMPNTILHSISICPWTKSSADPFQTPMEKYGRTPCVRALWFFRI